MTAPVKSTDDFNDFLSYLETPSPCKNNDEAAAAPLSQQSSLSSSQSTQATTNPPSASKSSSNVAKPVAVPVATMNKVASAQQLPALPPPIVVKTGKVFTWTTLLQDHTRFITILPEYLLAYVGGVGPFKQYSSLPPRTIESVMLTMNSINTCPYCTGLHGQLGRMAGISNVDGGVGDNNSNNNSNHLEIQAVKYAKTFALQSGRGGEVESSYSTLVKELDSCFAQHQQYPDAARSINALCWALLWCKTTGNTINMARDKILRRDLHSSITSLEMFVFIYYGPLFAIIGVLNLLLLAMPKLSPGVQAGLGAFLWLPQAINIVPLGVVSLVWHFGIV